MQSLREKGIQSMFANESMKLKSLQNERLVLEIDASDIKFTIYYFCPYLPEGWKPSDVTGMLCETYSGEIANLWVTNSLQPCDLNSYYNQLIKDDDIIYGDNDFFVNYGNFSGVFEKLEDGVLTLSFGDKFLLFDAIEIDCDFINELTKGENIKLSRKNINEKWVLVKE
jgi:hypothetical protein